jgi:Sulfotransferase family
MSDGFRLVMISAMYENGGNTTHRLLDGHPEMFVYPFESQLGTRFVADRFSAMFPARYRWPWFPLDSTPESDCESFIDEECRVRARTPTVSKFRDHPFDFSDDDRTSVFVEYVRGRPRSRAVNVAGFITATFEAWRDCRRSGRERVYVGYSPIVVVDTEAILADFPDAHLIHVVRNPWSAYADTKKRPVPMSLSDYMLCWSIVQQLAIFNAKRFPDRVHIVRAEDVMADSLGALTPVCHAIGCGPSDTLATISWNGVPLAEVYPWGTIRTPTPAANRAAAGELSVAEREEIRSRSWNLLEQLDYGDFVE